MMSEEKDPVKNVQAIDVSLAHSTSDSAQSTHESPHKISSAAVDQISKANMNQIENAVENDDDAEEDSEAETLIQSPEKKRNIVDSAPSLQPTNGGSTTGVVASAPRHDIQSRKRKRSVNENHIDSHSPNNSHRSSPLSSPVPVTRSDASDSEKSVGKKLRKSDRPKSRRAGGVLDSTVEMEDKSETQNQRKRQSSDATIGHGHRREKSGADGSERRETRSATYPRHSDTERSPSPPSTAKREHRRGVSTQLTPHEHERRKRGRPPLISTQRRQSMERTGSPESDRSNSPAPTRSGLHKFTSHDHDTMSPVKSGPRKRRDKNGRTAVARHANSGNLDMVKAELAEHREDLNLADNAGNTPLQIAALEGHIDIVEYLLSQRCEVDTRNIDKDTPLIDAVENGHVEVVKLLLGYGANPRVGNAKGDEPYELVPEDDENYVEIRKLLAFAKDKSATKQRGGEQGDSNNRDGNSSRAASAASPRDSPPVGPRSPPAFSSRRRTGRSESTRNDLLWQAHNQPTLTKLAGKGDVQGVANILNILQKAETESLIAAAKAGHEEVLQHLLAMGDPDPDPSPVKSLPPGYNTPLLAAIGRGHTDVVKLLISQSGFDPTRKLYGRYYFELARERKGTNWQQEHEVLKSAYDNFASGKGRKQISPRKVRDLDKAKQRSLRRSASPAPQKRLSASPTMTHKSLPLKSAESSPKEKRKVSESGERRKVSGNKVDAQESSVAVVSDLDQTVTVSKKGHRPRRSQSDLPIPQGIDGEPPYRRRRLVTGKEHRRNKSAAPGSISDDDGPADMIEVKQEEHSASTLKRSRSSQTPEASLPESVERNQSVTKKRRTVESSPEEGRTQPPKSATALASRKVSTGSDRNQLQNGDIGKNEDRLAAEQSTRKRRDSRSTMTRPRTSDQHTVSEHLEALPDASLLEQDAAPSDDKMSVQESTLTNMAGKTEVNTEPIIISNKEDDVVNPDFLGASATPGPSEATVVKSEADALAEAERIAAQQAETLAAEEAARQAEEEREAIRRREEEEAIAAKKKAEEAQARQRAEEEAQRRKEEEEKQEQKRREMELRRRQQDLENERRRIAKLPATLGKTAELLDDNNTLARDEKWLREKYLPLLTVTMSQLDPDCNEEVADERWVPNYQVAGLLATKDLNLRAYTSIDKRPVNMHERVRLWGVSRIQLSFDYLMNWGLGISSTESLQRERENREKFMVMEEVFWVKLSDFQDQIFRYPHLTGLKIQTQAISLKTWEDVIGQTTPRNSPKIPTRMVNGNRAPDHQEDANIVP